ncbi:hypothetical protein NSU02_13650 [Aeribacillus sp. FSL W8-0870]|uniref:hypothetical protein n=1 Tax=Aeribacillus sp. FSL W8-0870 TaxID=2954706 RepID=UPI0030D1992B
MKRLFSALLVIFFSFVIYYDLKNGTLPVSSIQNEQHAEEQFMKVKVKEGDTVLSIVEKIHNKPVPASIEEIIKDFGELNSNEDVYSIQAGKTYKFPLYNN